VADKLGIVIGSADAAGASGSPSPSVGELVVDAAWPITILLIAFFAWMLVRRSPAIRYGLWRRLRGVKSMKAFGWEVAFLDDEKAVEVSRDLNDAIDMFKRRVSEHYKRAADKLLLNDSVESATSEYVAALKADGLIVREAEWRATIHCRHAFLAEHYLQLCPYFGPRAKRTTVGRAYPFRWGVVGLTFRLQAPQRKHAEPANPETLVRQWGLTLQEARARADSQTYSFLTIPLRSDSAIVGVLFLEFELSDRAEVGVFTSKGMALSEAQLAQEFEKTSVGATVAEKVARIHDRVSDSEPTLHPLDDLSS